MTMQSTTSSGYRWGGVLTAFTALLVMASPVGAHGVDIIADLEGRPAQLELTDETGEVCLRFSSAVDPADLITIAVVSTGQTALELGGGFGVEEVCQFLDPDSVDAVLADVDGHELVRRQPNGSVSRATLQKPLPPVSETALVDTTDDGGPNVRLIFAIGGCLGIAIAVLRKRFRPTKR